MTRRDQLIRDLDEIEEAMIRLGGRADIWQDRMLWHICRAIYDLLKWAIRREDAE